MSGGVDSSAAAFMLQQQGYDCVGVFMTNWDSSDEVGIGERCSISKDKTDAWEVCQRLNIPLVEVDFVKEYWNDVFVPFLSSYQSGQETPNPDVYCNRFIKFDAFLKYATKKLDVDFIATGHYARISDNSGGSRQLLRGIDHTKDQTYFLSLVQSGSLEKVLFPIGNYLKSEIRDMVSEPLHGLSVLSKKESMGVCFIGKRNLKDFLGQYIDFTPGNFICADSGQVVGHHDGAEGYTIGQGAKIGGVSGKYFIAGNHPDEGNDGDLLVVNNSTHPLLMSKQLLVRGSSVSWVSGESPVSLVGERLLRCQCKTRYRQDLVWCEVEILNDGDLLVTFDYPERAITGGQVLALYSSDVCLGGGIISGGVKLCEDA
jgi:tRNA-uridine 2-sulfurtransferase